MITVKTSFHPVSVVNHGVELFGNKIIVGSEDDGGGISEIKISDLAKGIITQQDINTISTLRTLRSLTIYNTDLSKLNLDGFFNLTKLSCLHLQNCELTDDQIKFISNLADSEESDLIDLNISGNHISKIPDNLGSMKDLCFIDFSWNNISDLSPMRSLEFRTLDKLQLSFNEISDISQLRDIRICILGLGHNKISDISCMEDDFDQSVDLLKRLDLGHNNISDISVLKHFPNLQFLSLEYNNISDINVIGCLPNLQYLNLRHNNIESISSLTNHENLRNLVISDNNICSLVPLGTLKVLLQLTAENCMISNFRNVFSKNNIIRRLYISNNLITDIEFLKDLPNLANLKILNNPILDLSILYELPNLMYLSIDSRKLTPDFVKVLTDKGVKIYSIPSIV